MKFFIDTANVDEIRKANDMGVICGNVTQLSFLQINGFVCIQREKDVVNKKD